MLIYTYTLIMPTALPATMSFAKIKSMIEKKFTRKKRKNRKFLYLR